jgi:hypothetical protein
MANFIFGHGVNDIFNACFAHVKMALIKIINVGNIQMTQTVCLKGKKNIYGPKLERPEAENVVYVGRRFTMGGWDLPQSIFANRYTVKEFGRESSIRKYRRWLKRMCEDPQFMIELCKLKNKTLACWCTENEECHAKVLAEVVLSVAYKPL